VDETTQTPGENSAGSPTAPSEHTGQLDAAAVARAFEDADRPELETDNAQETASGSEIPAPDAETEPNPPAMIPSHRLREETEKRREIEERYKPWDGIIQSLTEKGYTPDEIAQVLSQGAEAGEEADASPYAAPEAPAEPQGDLADPDTSDLELEFERHLRARGIDPYTVETATLDLYRDNWETRRLVEQSQAKAQAEAEQARHAAETAAWSNRWEADVEAVKAKFPDLPQLQDVDGSLDLIAAYTRRHGTTPNREQFQAFVDRNYVQPLQSRIAQATQAYAAAKAGDAVVPSVAGGSSPAPVDRPDFHNMKPADQERFMTQAARDRFTQAA
jgi:hypothetical protein